MIPLRVVAHTPAGFAASDPWSPALDGILAYWRMKELLPADEFAAAAAGTISPVECEDLPLTRIEFRGDWWWAASSPIVASDRKHLAHYHKRFDAERAADRVPAGRSGKVLVTAGPYKNYRNVDQIRLTPTVEWHCIGDPDEIRRLLRHCNHIGGGFARGRGRVMRWEITEDHADESLALRHRPVPVAYAARHGIDGARMEWGIRPSPRDPAHRMLCVVPS